MATGVWDNADRRHRLQMARQLAKDSTESQAVRDKAAEDVRYWEQKIAEHERDDTNEY